MNDKAKAKDINQQINEMLEGMHVFNQQLDQIQKIVRASSGFQARTEIESLKAALPEHRLERYGHKVFSQADEDGILAEILNRLGIQNGLFCEIGVETGNECNTHYLLYQGWRGGWIDGNSDKFAQLTARSHNALKRRILSATLGYATPHNVNDIIGQAMKMLDCTVEQIDLLSIDIDGMDIYLWEALNFNPKVIIIEYNAKFPPHINLKMRYQENQKWDHSDYFGSSLLALCEVAAAKSYHLVATNLLGSNAFFVHQSVLNDQFIGPFTPELLYNPPRYYLLQHYSHDVGHGSKYFGDYISPNSP